MKRAFDYCNIGKHRRVLNDSAQNVTTTRIYLFIDECHKCSRMPRRLKPTEEH